jgi:hypothetical protein
VEGGLGGGDVQVVIPVPPEQELDEIPSSLSGCVELFCD